ncbi:MAG: exodeoxyribonuclease I [Gammaproteobacteria bacterium]|nr:exodeoxyribonuclease I [Gammaproteobacteria bacterium]
MSQSFFWYDLETFGRDPRFDRIAQFAGIRTDLDLNIIDDPVELFCRPSPDYLPDPVACTITGITPQHCLEVGMSEADFAERIARELSQPGTCTVGFNSLRFDDEFIRNLFYKNLLDPYAREWQNQNSRWDLLDVVRAFRALRPGDIVWPTTEDGRPSNKLELLSAANGLAHDHAHDAVSDVIATIEVAKRLKQSSPKLFDYAFKLRDKRVVTEMMEQSYGRLLLHVSGRAPAAREHTTLISPICPHPSGQGAWIVADVCAAPQSWWHDDPEVLRSRLYAKAEALGDSPRPPIKVLRANRCPFIATPKVLGERAQTLGIDLAAAESNLNALLALNPTQCLSTVFDDPPHNSSGDVDSRLYGGFIGKRDRAALESVREALLFEPVDVTFDDPRLPELIFRYRAKNAPEMLGEQEMQRWMQHCIDKLNGDKPSNLTLCQFDDILSTLDPTENIAKSLGDYRNALCEHLGL